MPIVIEASEQAKQPKRDPQGRNITAQVKQEQVLPPLSSNNDSKTGNEQLQRQITQLTNELNNRTEQL